MVKVAAAAAAVGSIAAIGFVGNSPAQADPKQFDALAGFGSDTTQDVLNAFAGFANGINYTPVQSQDATKTQLVSWDAFPANQCITTATGAPTILRPNGSTNGQRILSRAFGGGTWGNATCGQRDVSGIVDFARSSSPPAAAGTDLVFIPFGRDAISWAYSKPTGSPVTNLTPAQLSSLQVNGPAVINGTVIIPCGIQTGSGTYATWNGMLGLPTTGTPDTGTAFCNTGLVNPAIPDPGGRLQESNGPELKLKADVLATTSNAICDGVAGGPAVSCADAQVIIGFAASSWIARSNGVGSVPPGPGVAIGSINGNSPVSGTAPNLVPNATFYADPVFGRDVYNVLPAETVDDIGNVQIQTMFVGPTSSVCQATATIQQFGFGLLGANCGSTTLTGPFRS
jgi:hypothetical protein